MPTGSSPRNANDIAIILPVWNGRERLPACLAALSRQQTVSFDVIAVDNASTDGSAHYIQSHWPDIQLIHSVTNLGLAGACNRAVAEANRYDTLVVLHQDAEPLPDWLVHLVAPIRSNPSIAIAGAKAIFPNGTIEHAGGRIDSRGIGRPIGRTQPDRRQFNSPAKAEYVSSTSFAFSRQAYRAIGPFDEAFAPASYEDMDWCCRARDAGYHVVYAPKSRLIHNTTGASGEEMNAFAFHRNRLRFILKHWSLHRLVDDFIPAEQRWLAGLAPNQSYLKHALHRAYLHQIIRVGEIVHAREHAFPSEIEEIHGLAAVLLSLRTLYPEHSLPVIVRDTEALAMKSGPPKAQGKTARTPRSLRRGLGRIAHARIFAPVSAPLFRFNSQQQLAQALLDQLVEIHQELGVCGSAEREQEPANRK